MKVSVRFSSSIFCTCVSVWLPEETLKLALKNVFNKHLFQGFWKGWMVLLCLWYVFYMTLFLKIIFCTS